MRTLRLSTHLLAGLILGTLVAGCSTQAPSPTPTSSPTSTISITPTISATACPTSSTPTPSATPTTSAVPTSFAEDYTPSFKTLAFGKRLTDFGETPPPDYTPVIDFSGEAPENVAVNLAFNTMAIPLNTCGGVEASNDPATLEASAQRYADCLLDAWVPFATEHGLSPLFVEVLDCSLHPEASECADDRNPAAAANDHRVVLSEGLHEMIAGGASSGQVTLTIAHELAHVLQQTLVRPDGSPTVYIGVAEAFDARGRPVGLNCRRCASLAP